MYHVIELTGREGEKARLIKKTRFRCIADRAARRALATVAPTSHVAIVTK